MGSQLYLGSVFFAVKYFLKNVFSICGCLFRCKMLVKLKITSVCKYGCDRDGWLSMVGRGGHGVCLWKHIQSVGLGFLGMFSTLWVLVIPSGFGWISGVL